MTSSSRAWAGAAQVVVLALSLALPRWTGAAEIDWVKRIPLTTSPSFVGYVPDAFIVVLTAEARRQIEVRQGPGRPIVNLPSIQQALDVAAALSMEREFAGARPHAAGSYPDLTGHYEVRLPPGADLDAAIATFAADPHVDHVEKIGIHTIDLTPNDTYFQYGTPSFPNDQWHYWDANGIDADLAWNTETGSPSVLVGILDTGIKYRHTDLGGANPPGPADNSTNGNVWVNPGEIPGNGIDDDGNGFVDDVIGWDFVSTVSLPPGYSCTDADCGGTDNDPNDGNGHGTHVAGTVAAITNNARAVAGIAGGFSDGTTAGAGNGCRVIPLRMGYTAKKGQSVVGIVQMDWAAQAMNYVADLVDRGMDVAAVNCSWGSSDTGGLSAAVDNLQAHDVLVVNAAGNDGTTIAPFLCTKAGVMAVAATDSFGTKATFSNHGSWVDISAPGVSVLSTWHEITDPDTTHMYVAVLDGTSMSAPHICGVAALLESYNPSLTRTDKFNLMRSTAFVPSGFPSDMGAGIVNAYQALLAAPPPVGVADGPALPGRLALRARPNPTHGRTELVVDGPAGASAQVEIVDMSGRRVRALTGVAGGSVRWDGTDAGGRRVPIGLYLAIARCGGSAVTTKLALVH